MAYRERIAWTVRRFDQLDSTNRYLLDEARAGAPEGLVAVADHQTAGRGRLGRTWVAPPGSSLLLSVLLRPDLPPSRLHLVTAAVALAAADALEDVAGLRPDVKWPNDLVVGDRKLAGVLAESHLPAVVVGIGINVNWPAKLPAEVAGVATAANLATGRPVERDLLLEALLAGLSRLHGAWDEVAARYRRECATVGRDVRVELPGRTLEGRAVAVTEEGHLVVEGDGAVHVVTAGDVVHVRPAGEH